MKSGSLFTNEVSAVYVALKIVYKLRVQQLADKCAVADVSLSLPDATGASGRDAVCCY
jgi:hypothetical protein